MHNFSDEVIDEVLSANDIVDVVGVYVRLDKKGKYMFGLCPFHKEKSASFSVTPSKQIFYCYSCQKGGNALHFIMGVENLSFIEALKLLAEKAKITLPEYSNKQDEEKNRLKKEIIKINTDAARFFHQVLLDKKGEDAREYLKERKLSEGIVTKFGLGYSPKEGNGLYKHFISLGYNEYQLKKSGLILENGNGKCFDRFRGRIMFPIFDIRGSVIAFGGRVMDDTQPKYMNSPETPVYNKGKNLYALNFVRKAGDKKIIIVEGYMDVISLHQSGIINTVASLGTALTEEQGRLLRMYGEEIIIAYDTDPAGQKATFRGLDILDELGCNVKVLKVPKGKDPDDYIKVFGAESFKKLIDKASTLLEYKVSLLREQMDDSSTSGKIDFLNKTADVLAKVDNSIEREMFIKRLSREYDIRQDSLESEVHKKMSVQGKKKQNEFDKKEIKEVTKSFSLEGGLKSNNYERMLIALLCLDNSIYKITEHNLRTSLLNGQMEKDLFEIVVAKLKSGKGITTAELLRHINEEQVGEFVRIIDKDCIFEDNLKAFNDIFKKLEIEALNRRQQEILELLKINDVKDEIYSEKLKQEFMMIMNQKKNF